MQGLEAAVGEEFLLSYFAKWLRENQRTEQHVNHALAVLRAGGVELIVWGAPAMQHELPQIPEEALCQPSTDSEGEHEATEYTLGRYVLSTAGT
eukprot:4463048-Amphidinium_carterae.1